MSEINIKNIVDDAFQDCVAEFMTQLETTLKEDPEISATDYIAKILPDILLFSKNITINSLEKYHQQLVTHLNSANI